MSKKASVLIAGTAALFIGAAIFVWVGGKNEVPTDPDPAASRALRAAGIALELAEAARPHLEFLPEEDRAVVGALIETLGEKAVRLISLAGRAATDELDAAADELELMLSEIITDYSPGAYQNEGSVSP